MKVKEALKILNHRANSRARLYFNDYGEIERATETIKAELDKLDRIKEVVKDCDWGNVLNYPHDKIIGIHIIKQIIEE